MSWAIPNDLTSRTLSGSPKANGNHETKNQTGDEVGGIYGNGGFPE